MSVDIGYKQMVAERRVKVRLGCVRNTIDPHWTDITKCHPNFRLHDHTYVCRRCRGMYINRLVFLRCIHLETTFERRLVANL